MGNRRRVDRHALVPARLFSISSPRLLRSTLFPYTTLFRSAVTGDACGKLIARNHPIEYRGVLRQAFVQRIDRKSTRLNSSHGYISYAVFCLKKKKEEQTIP